MFSSLEIFKNPLTGEYASLFIHNIRTIIVTDSITVHCDDNNKGYRTLKELGFTEKLIQSAAISL